MCIIADGSTKPILDLTRDGHGGPRFPSTRNTLFNIVREHDLDFLFVFAMLQVFQLTTLLKGEWPH